MLGGVILIGNPNWTGQARQATLLMATRVGGLFQIGSAATDIVSLHTKCPYWTGIEAGLGFAAFTGALRCSGLPFGYLHVGDQQTKSIRMPESILRMNHQTHSRLAE